MGRIGDLVEEGRALLEADDGYWITHDGKKIFVPDKYGKKSKTKADDKPAEDKTKLPSFEKLHKKGPDAILPKKLKGIVKAVGKHLKNPLLPAGAKLPRKTTIALGKKYGKDWKHCYKAAQMAYSLALNDALSDEEKSGKKRPGAIKATLQKQQEFLKSSMGKGWPYIGDYLDAGRTEAAFDAFRKKYISKHW